MEKSEASHIAIEIANSLLAKDKEPVSHIAEAEAIVLIRRLLPIANYILLDELAAREIAERRGLPITGFAGILLWLAGINSFRRRKHDNYCLPVKRKAHITAIDL